jgi:very-long-chain enoyl-CoA reductase
VPPVRRSGPDDGFNDTQATVSDLKKKIHKAKSALYPARQRLTLPPPPGAKSGDVLKDGATLESVGLKDGSVVLFKDLGTQVWRMGAVPQPAS